MASIFWEMFPTRKFPKISLEIVGYSRAARHTSFFIKGYKILLDCGMPSDYDPQYIFITHCHADHSQSVPNMLLDSKQHKTIVCPRNMAGRLRDYIERFFTLTKNTTNHHVSDKYTIVDTIPDRRSDSDSPSPDSPALGVSGPCLLGPFRVAANKQWMVECIKCTHTVPTMGYGFQEIRKRLLPTVAEMPTEKRNTHIRKMVEEKREKEVFETVSVPLLLFMGDTDHRVLERSGEEMRKYPVIIIECTFIAPDDVRTAKADRHMHWDHLAPFIRANPETTFVLTHFSMKYSTRELAAFFEEKKKEYPNIDPILTA